MTNPNTHKPNLTLADIDVREDFDRSGAITLDQVVEQKLITGRGGSVRRDTLARWCRTGCEIGGAIVKIPAVKIAGEWLTMPEWAKAFENHRIEGGIPDDQPRRETPRQREREQKRSEERMRKKGFKVGSG